MTKEELKAHFKSRYQTLKDLRRPMESLWKLVDEVILPFNFNPTDNGNDQSITVNKKIYDGTGINASQIFSNTFAGTVIPRGTPWVNAVPEDEKLSRDRRVAGWGSKAERHIYSRLNRSNFYESRTSFIKEGADYGTSASYKHENPSTGELVFETIPSGTYYIDDNEYGECDTLWRVLPMYNKHVRKLFGDASLPTTVADRMKKNPDAKTTVLHIVEPRSDYDPTSKLAKKRKYGSYYVLEESFEIIEESGFDEFIYKIWRPFRRPGLVWGVGPGIFSIRDSHVLQTAAKTLLDAANRAVDPPWAVPAALEGDEELFPGGRNYVNPEDIAGLAPLVSGMAYPIGKDQINELRQAVQRHYMVDYFLMLNQMQAQQKTALEVSELQAEKSSMVSAIMSSFTSGYLDLELEEIVIDDIKSGRLEPLMIQGIPGVSFKFDYIGPLPQNQRTYHRTSAVRRVANELLPISKLIPSILDYFDEGEYAQAIAEGFNGLSVIRDEETVKKIQQARAQMQAQQMQMAMQAQQMQTAAEVASKGSQAPQDGSLADRAMKAGMM